MMCNDLDKFFIYWMRHILLVICANKSKRGGGGYE